MYFNEKHKQMVENRGDGYEYIGSYKCNEITIDNKNKKMNQNYIRVKCPYCGKEYDVSLSSFKRESKCAHCCNSYEKSFAYYIQQELKEPLNKYWDWKKNTVDPYLIYKSKGGKYGKVWIKCTKTDYHDSYETLPNNFYNGTRCPYCSGQKVHPKDSFAQWLINTYGNDAIKKYWSEKNDELGINPWKISPHSGETIWILCQEKDYHNDNNGYPITPANFYNGKRCPYCVNHNGKVHPKDSFGALYPSKAKHWSEKNDKSPFEVAPKSGDKCKFICQECGKEFDRSLLALNARNCGVYCTDCNNSQLEETTKRILQKYNIEYKREIKYEGLLGIGGRNLSYDFYLPKYNLLLELQGEQHEHFIKGIHRIQRNFERQLVHDKRKKQYAIDHNINFLEIWYYDIDNIEEILTKQLNL